MDNAAHVGPRGQVDGAAYVEPKGPSGQCSSCGPKGLLWFQGLLGFHKNKKGMRAAIEIIHSFRKFLLVIFISVRFSYLSKFAVLLNTWVSPSGDPNIILGGLRVPTQKRSYTLWGVIETPPPAGVRSPFNTV